MLLYIIWFKWEWAGKHDLLTRIFLEENEIDQAAAYLKPVRECYLRLGEAQTWASLIAPCASRFSEAIAAFELFTYNWPKLAHQQEVKQTVGKLRHSLYEPVLYNIGHTYLKLDQPELAISWLERALHREPQNLATLHQ